MVASDHVRSKLSAVFLAELVSAMFSEEVAERIANCFFGLNAGHVYNVIEIQGTKKG